MNYDFSGYATRNDLKCSDGRTIRGGAFRHQDGQKVPLVWQHQHNDPDNVLGFAYLEHRDDGVYAHAKFNSTAKAVTARELVEHGDVESLSIYANGLRQKGDDVIHGQIREVSLVLSGANPGAFIDNVSFRHGDGYDDNEDEAVIFTGLPIQHSSNDEEDPVDNIEHADDRTVQDVFDSMTDEQKNVVYFMLGQALEGEDEGDATHSDDSDDPITHSSMEGTPMKRNVFEQDDATVTRGGTLTHSQLNTIVQDAQKLGSFKEAVLAHADDYGITNIEVLFPDAKAIDTHPEWITRKMEWVEGILNGARKIPWSKIKSLSADLTHEEARAKGYIKGTMKKEQFFSIAKRETGPKTIYKKQKLDRDDITDSTEFDVVQWLWVEMNFMLREEIARAILIGDGREVDDPDKIDEDKIRPIAHDHAFYTDVVSVPAAVSGEALIEAILRGRPKYKGIGLPTMYTTEDILTDLILLKDKMGRRLYPTQAELESALRVSNIVTVPVLEGAMTNDGDLLAVLVNMSDYTIGSTRGGEITKFDDFDIDFNQYKYLIEGRMSGALTKHKRAQVIVRSAGTSVTPTVPTFVAATGVVTIPSKTGVVYKNQDTDATLTAGGQTPLDIGETLSVVAVPSTGYYFPHNIDADWDFVGTTDLA